jgi:hypothetical protein
MHWSVTIQQKLQNNVALATAQPKTAEILGLFPFSIFGIENLARDDPTKRLSKLPPAAVSSGIMINSSISHAAPNVRMIHITHALQNASKHGVTSG